MVSSPEKAALAAFFLPENDKITIIRHKTVIKLQNTCLMLVSQQQHLFAKSQLAIHRKNRYT
uniref:Uncharacterized protein n=1 Tax=uncultured bacterium CBNPD1 BAC clone 142 TaxID=417307 RepID=B1N6H1_9BACT|nr:conserved hypothetical protein [uncultured bacterium CBNPD1 BAC clone 142]